MKKYFNIALSTQIICVIYTIIHNYHHISQHLMFVVFGVGMVVSLYLYWQCFTNKELTKNQKRLGFILASIPLLGIIGFGVMMILFMNISH
jgi:heme O synthase-like polyprenyltransferase